MIYRIFFTFLWTTLAFQAGAQQKQEPWKPSQLIPTKLLAEKILADEATDMLIVSVGPGDPIEGSLDVGPGEEKKNIAALKSLLSKTPKDKEVVIYCGCCPFDKCPNIRPAFKLLTDMGFKNAKLLDVPKNIKVDWIDKGYPVKEEN